MAPSRTHQVEGMLPQVLPRWERVSKKAALCEESISKLSHVAVTAGSKAGEEGLVV